MAYALATASERRAHPGADLVSALVTCDLDGQPLSDEEVAWNFFILMGAGNDTTRTLILNAMNVLLDQPGAMGDLRQEPSLIPNAINEVLRLEPSVRGMGRTALQDVTLREQTIKAGDHVYLWYCSGNRDEETFDRPDLFDPRRETAKRHQAFGGGGPHFCIGAPLARLQARIFFEKLLQDFENIERDGAAVRARSTGFMNSLKSLPIRFKPGKRVTVRPLVESLG